MRLTTTTEKQNRLKELEQELVKTQQYIDKENSTTYANSDWNSASESPIKRIKIEAAAWRNDADQVEHVHHGVKINGKFIISMNNKWCNNFKKWYPYRDIDVLLRGLLA